MTTSTIGHARDVVHSSIGSPGLGGTAAGPSTSASEHPGTATTSVHATITALIPVSVPPERSGRPQRWSSTTGDDQLVVMGIEHDPRQVARDEGVLEEVLLEDHADER